MLVLNYRIWDDDYDKVAAQIFIDLMEKDPDVINIIGPEELDMIHLYRTVANKVFAYKGVEVNYIFGAIELDWYIKNRYHIPEQNIRVWLWPTIFFKICYVIAKLGTFFDTKVTTFKYPLISLNSRRRPHRCQMIDLMARENLIEGNAVTWHGIGDCVYNWQYFKERKLTLSEIPASKKDPLGFNEYCLVDEWGESFLHLISETHIDVRYISEKTVMCLMSGKLFIVWGAPGIHNDLRNMGFQLYDEIIDYSFDSIQNDDERLETIIKEVKRILALGNYEEIYQRISPALLHNQQRSIELGIEDSTPEILKKFNYKFYDRYKCNSNGDPLYPFGLDP